jgi:hypothetical protein
MSLVMAIAGFSGFLISCATAALASSFPAYTASMQDWAGGLIIGSAIFMIAGFPLM